MKNMTTAQKTAFYGILSALALLLSVLENYLIPDIPFLPPGAKIGLSNIPNPYGLEIGSVELIVSEDNQQKIGNQDISKPKDEDYVNYNEIDKIMKGI